MAKNIHTVPWGNNWAVKKEGQEKPISIHRTKDVTQHEGASLAKKLEVEHVIHGKDGTIQDKDSYGKDPCPPKDKKY